MKIRHLNLNGTIYDIAGNEYLRELSAEGNPWFLTSTVEYYVDAVNGNDENPGSESEPFATIQRAIEVCSSYHVSTTYRYNIHIREGTYNENVFIGDLGDNILNLLISGAVIINGSFLCSNSNLVIGKETVNATLSIMESSLTSAHFVLAISYCSIGHIECDISVTAYSKHPILIHQSNADFGVVSVFNTGTYNSIDVMFCSQVFMSTININSNSNDTVASSYGSSIGYEIMNGGKRRGTFGGRIYSGNQSISGIWNITDASAGVETHAYSKNDNVVTISITINPTKVLATDEVGELPSDCKPMVPVWGSLLGGSEAYSFYINENGKIYLNCRPTEGVLLYGSVTYVAGE